MESISHESVRQVLKETSRSRTADAAGRSPRSSRASSSAGRRRCRRSIAGRPRRRPVPRRPPGRDRYAVGLRNSRAAARPARRAGPPRPRVSAGGRGPSVPGVRAADEPPLDPGPRAKGRRRLRRGRSRTGGTVPAGGADPVGPRRSRRARRRRLLCFYTRFPPARARTLCGRIAFAHTPGRGPWLNTAGIELGVPGRRCPSRRIGDAETLRREVAARTAAPDAAAGTVNRQFAAEDARIKLRSIYPSFPA